jgi:hypothetical protein
VTDQITIRDRLRSFILAEKPKALPATTANAALSYRLPERMGKSSVELFRHWAEHSEWVRAAINIRKGQVSQSEWDIVAFDSDRPHSVRLAKQLRNLFSRPNPLDGDFRTFAERVIEDLLVLDAGCIEEVRGLGGQTVELWPVDGGTVKVATFWDGGPDEPRYFWYPDGYKEEARWVSDDFLYLMQNPRTYVPVGLSPLETLKMAIDSEIGGMAYNKRQVEGAAPDGMLNLGEGVPGEKVDEFKEYWDAEVAGRGVMAIVGGSKNPSFVDFKKSNRDMQFLEWQQYLVRKIAAVFMLSPQDLGLLADVNRATAEVQAENSEDRGLRPLLGLFQSALTREVVWDEAFGGPDNNLAFVFTRLNMKESLNRANINKLALAGMPWKTINEARREDGHEPYGPEYDKLMANTSQGLVTLEDILSARELAQQSNSGGGDGSSDGSSAPRANSKPTGQN